MGGKSSKQKKGSRQEPRDPPTSVQPPMPRADSNPSPKSPPVQMPPEPTEPAKKEEEFVSKWGFRKYAPSGEMEMEGLVQLFSDLGIDGEGADSLYLIYLAKAEDMTTLSGEEFDRLFEGGQKPASAIAALKEDTTALKPILAYLFEALNRENP